MNQHSQRITIDYLGLVNNFSTKILVLLGLAIFSVVHIGNSQDVNGYEAIGHLTYSRFDVSGKVTHKIVMMFDVKIRGEEWFIRTEPVIEGNGVGFYEASYFTDDYVMRVTGLNAAYKSSESPFQSLRSELKESKKQDVYFTNNSHRVAATYSNLFSASTQPKRTTIQNKKTNVMQADNVAVAVAIKGKYPPVDPSYVAFLWFAFTTPNEQDDGTNKMLLQIWDDGNPQKNRFRRASWNQFLEQPKLASSAVYNWIGKDLMRNGTLVEITTSDVDKPDEMAARYDVFSTTNFNGLKLPLNFKLTRFMTRRATNGEQVISTTVDGAVVRIKPLKAGEAMGVNLPGKTFVSDYRFSSGELNGADMGYFSNSNALPAIEQMKQTRLFKDRVTDVKKSTQSQSRRWILIGALSFSSLGAVALGIRFISHGQRNKTKTTERRVYESE